MVERSFDEVEAELVEQGRRLYHDPRCRGMKLGDEPLTNVQMHAIGRYYNTVQRPDDELQRSIESWVRRFEFWLTVEEGL